MQKLSTYIIGHEVKIGKGAGVEEVEAYSVTVSDDAEIKVLTYVEKAEISEEAEVKKISRVDKLSVDLKWCVEAGVGTW